MRRFVTAIGISILAINLSIQAQDESDLAKATQNPVSDIISLPFQNNTTYGNAPYNRAQNILNIQPVIPIKIGTKVNMINQWVSGILVNNIWTFGDIS